MAITALARHLLVLAWTLLIRGEKYQQLERWGYLRKLAILAASRPAAERKAGGGTTDIAWARERYRELAGEAPPVAVAGPQAGPPEPNGRGISDPKRRGSRAAGRRSRLTTIKDGCSWESSLQTPCCSVATSSSTEYRRH